MGKSKVVLGLPFVVVVAWGLLLTVQANALQESLESSGESSGESSAESSAQAEEVLKGRVDQLYTLLLNNRVADAEAYVTQDSVENFRRLSNNPFVGFTVNAVHLGPDGTDAEVETTILFMPPQGTRPMPFPRKTNWRLENGEWRLFLPLVARQNVADVYAPGRTPPPRTTPAAPADLQFDAPEADLGVIRKDQKPQVRFSFTNISDHPVRISEVATGCDCLRATKEDKMYAPGESGEVAIEFDPTAYAFLYKQTIVVKTEPGGHRHLLLIEAQVFPPRSRPAE